MLYEKIVIFELLLWRTWSQSVLCHDRSLHLEGLVTSWKSRETVVNWALHEYQAATLSLAVSVLPRDDASRMWHCVVGHVLYTISEDYSALVFRVRQFKQTAWPWRWRHCDPLKLWELYIWNNVTCQKNSVFSSTAVRTLNVAWFLTIFHS